MNLEHPQLDKLDVGCASRAAALPRQTLHFPHMEEGGAGKEEVHSTPPPASDRDASFCFGLSKVEWIATAGFRFDSLQDAP